MASGGKAAPLELLQREEPLQVWSPSVLLRPRRRCLSSSEGPLTSLLPRWVFNERSLFLEFCSHCSLRPPSRCLFLGYFIQNDKFALDRKDPRKTSYFFTAPRQESLSFPPSPPPPTDLNASRWGLHFPSATWLLLRHEKVAFQNGFYPTFRTSCQIVPKLQLAQNIST